MPAAGSGFTEEEAFDTIVEEQADVAQLVEQLIRNQQVVSSSLTVGSISASYRSGWNPLTTPMILKMPWAFWR
jgi:hypothetical protein